MTMTIRKYATKCCNRPMDIAANKAKDFSGYCATHLPENVAADKQYFAKIKLAERKSI